jgi:hypothetical protein
MKKKKLWTRWMFLSILEPPTTLEDLARTNDPMVTVVSEEGKPGVQELEEEEVVDQFS